MNEQDMKVWIDNATYESLLRRWRNAEIGDKIFIGEIGDYYSEVMAIKKREIGIDDAISTSKFIGWE